MYSTYPMKKGFAAVFILLVVVILAVGGYFFVNYQKTNRVDTSKVYHVGILSALDYFYPSADAFKQKMTKLGYIEGKNIIYDIQKGPAPVGNQKILKKFVDDKVDLIYVFPTEASLEAKDVTKGTGIPVIASEAYMDGNGLISSVQHPGGNLTGVRFPITEVAIKRLEILHEIAPKVKNVWVPVLKDYPTSQPAIKALAPLAKSLGITVTGGYFTTPDEMAAFFKSHSTDPGMDAILLVPEPVSIVPAFADQINAFAYDHKLPIAGVALVDSDHGPIFSLIPTANEFGTLAAPLADKIFKGTNAGTIPVVTPESELEINIKTVKRLGLSASEGLLSTAKKIIR